MDIRIMLVPDAYYRLICHWSKIRYSWIGNGTHFWRCVAGWHGYTALGKESDLITTMAILEAQRFPEPERSQALSLLRPKRENFYPSGKKWVLRNLTTREFVRGESVHVYAKGIDGSSFGVVGFGEVVLVRICWSSYSSTSLGYNGGIIKGHGQGIGLIFQRVTS